ncbi:EAL domain-containing protein [Thiocapsa rosea]|uniref:PAS domain S-box-containing protein/diguanylate cyclase (GGDEF)-like protein n=1 Tax=Thiocapsa rosea TaxID=69360 RepID=A0A495V7U6_9GAMM|nr:EAL domain-containing protein [Thiocapsa rosea]RKT45354.1 PAS domain S-box-containing protein/diguanylate cyclase (GGDEF)-like protein [Thiocapsa rosea]
MHRLQPTEEHTTRVDSARRDTVDLVRLLDALPCCAVVLDADQRIVAATRAFSALLGYPRGFPTDLAFGDLLEDEDASRVSDFLATGETETNRTVRLRTRAGPPVMTIMRLLRLAPGEAPAAPVVSIVIEPRAIPSTPLRLELPGDEAQAFAGVANWEIDVATGRVLASRTWYDIWGFEPDTDVTLDAVLAQIHPDDRDVANTAVKHAIEDAVPFRFRHRIIRPDGTQRWAESAGRLEPAGSDGAPKLSGVVLDITQRRAAEEALARYYDIVSASPDRIAFLDRSCCLLAANAAFLAAIQRTQDNAVGRPLQEVAGQGPLSELVYRNLGRCLDGGHPAVDDIYETGPDGQVRESEVRLFPHRDDEDKVTGIVVNIRDVTSVRDSERRLLQSAVVYAATSDGVLMTDADGRIVAVNAAFSRITGYAEAEVLGRKPSLLNSHWHTKSFFTRMWRRLVKQGVWEGEIWNRRKDGEIYLQRLHLRRILDGRGKVTNFVGVFAERPVSANGPKHVEFLAHYDPLTKLPNRLLFDSRLVYAMDPARRNRTPVALFLLDLDRFANINASLGHQIGDELLRAVGLRLRETIRPADTLARLSGNQFGLLFEGIQTPTEAQEIARRLHSALRAPMTVRGHQVFVTMSMGIALETGAGIDTEVMITHAATALGNVKQGGRNGFRIYSEPPVGTSTARQRLTEMLRVGLETGEFELLYQPRVELETGRWRGAGVRVRWHQPDLGLVAHDRLLPLIESGGMMIDLGQWVLAEACRQLRDWSLKGIPIGILDVSISESQLTRFDLVPSLERLLQSNEIDPARLALSFAEPLLFKHPERAREVLDGLYRLGVGLTLSEVGTSWLAPQVLRRLPIRRLEIHRSFVDAMPNSPDDLAVVQALIAMAQALDIDITADGVRDDRQRFILLNIGCLDAQGSLFAPPLTAPHYERCLLQVSAPPPDTPIEPRLHII